MRYKEVKKPLSNNVNLDFILKIDGEIQSFVPADPKNKDYKEYLHWLSLGNSPEAAD